MNATKGWQSLSYQWVKDFQLFLFVLTTLSIFRVILLLTFGGQTADSSTALDFLSVFWMGFRVDMGTAAAWVLLTFLLSLSCSKFSTHQRMLKIRKFSAEFFIVAAVLVLGIDLVFFKVYGDHYNQMLVGLIYDDAAAIFTTIWKEHSPVLFISLFVVIIFFFRKLVNFWMEYELAFTSKFSGINSSAKKVIVAFGCIILFVFTMRGGDVSGAPLQIKHVFVTNDSFLNRAIVNPFFALRLTIKNQLALNSKNGLSVYWNPDKLPQALKLIAPDQNETSEIDKAIIKTAPGVGENKPRHVFLILMESYSGWTLLPQYKSAGFSNGLAPYAEEGIHFTNFLSATRATADSLSVLVSGLPYAGLNINHESKSLKQYPTSIAKIFSELGYKTRFIYGGYIGWQRLDTFIEAQGFDEIYSAADITTPTTGNEWGVDDEHMFKQAEQLIDDETPSFNFILSTTSHSPYDLDLEQQGYPITSFPSNITKIQGNALEVMGHHWYADRELAKFLKTMNQKLSKPLFSITGDHPTRVQLKFNEGTLREREAVPLIIYGPEIIKNKTANTNAAGGHQDIIPTLVNLTAPENYKYAAFGKDMFIKTNNDIGVGLNHMIGSNFIVPLDFTIDPQLFDGNEPALNENQRNQALNEINAMRGIGWYRVRKGNTLAITIDHEN